MLIHKKYIAHTLWILLFFTNEIKSQSHEGHDHSQPSKKEDTVKPTKELKKSNSKSVEVETVKPEIVPNEEIKPIDIYLDLLYCFHCIAFACPCLFR